MSSIEIKQILVIRNDTTTAWEDSQYVLLRGEMGIGWIAINNEKKPIVKIGDGENLWKNLPQSESIFLEDLNLSHSFGRHIVENGSVNAGGQGMTVSEWIKDALIVEKNPKIEQPNIAVIFDAINTDSGTFEIGSIVNEVVWHGNMTTGHYEYGSFEDRSVYVPTLDTTCIAFLNNEKVGEFENAAPSGLYNPNFQITGTYEQNIGTVKINYSWGNAELTPVTNLGNAYPNGKIVSGKKSSEQTVSVTGYREGLFYGGTSDELTVEAIRALNVTGMNYLGDREITFDILPGTKMLIFAYPDDEIGVTSVYNNTVNAEMMVGDNFKTIKMQIPGANGFSPIDYVVKYYEPAHAYENKTNITIKLG